MTHASTIVLTIVLLAVLYACAAPRRVDPGRDLDRISQQQQEIAAHLQQIEQALRDLHDRGAGGR